VHGLCLAASQVSIVFVEAEDYFRLQFGVDKVVASGGYMKVACVSADKLLQRHLPILASIRRVASNPKVCYSFA